MLLPLTSQGRGGRGEAPLPQPVLGSCSAAARRREGSGAPPGCLGAPLSQTPHGWTDVSISITAAEQSGCAFPALLGHGCVPKNPQHHTRAPAIGVWARIKAAQGEKRPTEINEAEIMKQQPAFPATSNRQVDQTGALLGAEAASRSPPSPRALLPPLPPLLSCPAPPA